MPIVGDFKEGGTLKQLNAWGQNKNFYIHSLIFRKWCFLLMLMWTEIGVGKDHGIFYHCSAWADENIHFCIHSLFFMQCLSLMSRQTMVDDSDIKHMLQQFTAHGGKGLNIFIFVSLFFTVCTAQAEADNNWLCCNVTTHVGRYHQWSAPSVVDKKRDATSPKMEVPLVMTFFGMEKMYPAHTTQKEENVRRFQVYNGKFQNSFAITLEQMGCF